MEEKWESTPNPISHRLAKFSEVSLGGELGVIAIRTYLTAAAGAIGGGEGAAATTSLGAAAAAANSTDSATAAGTTHGAAAGTSTGLQLVMQQNLAWLPNYLH